MSTKEIRQADTTDQDRTSDSLQAGDGRETRESAYDVAKRQLRTQKGKLLARPYRGNIQIGGKR